MTSAVEPFVARNNSATSDNLIHSDPEAARRMGFTGGALVPGLTCYAWMARTLASDAVFGADWTSTGWIEVRYLAPVHEGEALRVVVEPLSDHGGSSPAGVTVRVVDEQDGTRASGTAGLGAPLDEVPRWPDAEAPDELYPLDEEGLLSAPWIATTAWIPRRDEAAELLAAIGMPAPVGDPDRVDLGYAARSYRPAVARTFRRLGPSVHTASRVHHLRPLRYDEPLVIRGRVDRLFARRGHRYVACEFVWHDAEDQPVMHATQTRIYRLRR